MISVYQLNYCIGPGKYHHEHYMFASTDDINEDEEESLIGYSFPTDFDHIGVFDAS